MTPLVHVVFAFAGGIVLGLRMSLGHAALVVMSGSLLALSAMLFRRGSESVRACGVLFGVLGVVAGAAASLGARTDCRATLPDGATIGARGTLESAARPGGTASLRLESIRVGGRVTSCSGSLRVRLPPRRSPPPAGALLDATGVWWAFPHATGWPEPPGRGGTLGLRSVRVVEDGRAGNGLSSARGHAQQRVRALFPRQSGLAEALVLAERGGIDAEVKQDFAAAGMMHLLSISGTHVGLVAAALLLAGSVLRLPLPWAAAGAGAATIAYVLFLGAPDAAARAALQIVLLLAARLTQRPSNPFTLLAFAALVLLVADPLAVLGAGFQLSFAGIYGLLSLRRPLLDRLPRAMPRCLRDGLAAGTAATLVTTPIAALHFGLVSWIGILANLIAVPLVAVAVPGIAVALIVGAISESAGAFIASGVETTLTGLAHIARLAATVPFGHAYVSDATVWIGLAAAAAYLIVTGVLRRARPMTGRRGADAAGARRQPIPLAGAGAAIAVLIAGPLAPWAGAGGTLDIHAIDVGQGDALAIRSPAGRWIVVDTGIRSDDYDAGRSRVVPFLRQHGVRRVDILILTHPHADHIGGTIALLDAFDVGVIIDPAVAAGSEVYAETLGRARRLGVRWVAARPGREIALGDVVIQVLAPLENVLDASADPNDYSAVFRLAYGRFGALFLGDAPMEVENELVARHGAALAAQLLKVGHHGSLTSTGDSLLAAIRPSLAIVSAGRRNRYGHPHARVLARLAGHGVRVLRTDERGTISVRVDARGEMTATSTR